MLRFPAAGSRPSPLLSAAAASMWPRTPWLSGGPAPVQQPLEDSMQERRWEGRTPRRSEGRRQCRSSDGMRLEVGVSESGGGVRTCGAGAAAAACGVGAGGRGAAMWKE